MLTDVEEVRAVLTRHSEAKVSPESSVFFMNLDLKKEMQFTEAVSIFFPSDVMLWFIQLVY